MPGQLTDPKDARRYASALRRVREQKLAALSQRLVNGDVSLIQWQHEMKKELRAAWLEQYVTGRGGDRSMIQQTDYLALGTELARQYRYLNRFARAIQLANEQGKSLQFVIERSKMYGRASQAMFWKTAIPVDLPQTPRDGKTQCKINCKCYLDYEYVRDDTGAIIEVLVYWRLTPAEHCDDCKALAREWSPKRFKTDGMTESSIEQAVNLLISQDPHNLTVEAGLRELLGVEL